MTNIQHVFTERYGREATHVVRAPARVNLIGEHIDYNGLSVFPMAIQRQTTLLFAVRSDNTVRISNTDGRFAECEFSISDEIPPGDVGNWDNYVKAACQALMHHCGSLDGFDAVVSSDIPIAAGLSSSSALVIASALAAARANAVSIAPLELAALMATGERYVGTEGGGMDQAICLGAVQGTASRVDFNPLRLTAIPVPSDWRFIVADSLDTAAKSGNAQRAYNDRTRECAAALDAVVKHRGWTRSVSTYKELLERADVEDLLVTARDALDDVLFKRFRHVVTESIRVNSAEAAMRAADVEGFGRLMRESHASMRDDYEVSSAELDQVVGIALDAGAHGARLTGAGFGGCVVVLCDSDSSSAVQDALRARFYEERQLEGLLDDHLFVAQPSGGSSLTEL